MTFVGPSVIQNLDPNSPCVIGDYLEMWDRAVLVIKTKEGTEILTGLHLCYYHLPVKEAAMSPSRLQSQTGL